MLLTATAPGIATDTRPVRLLADARERGSALLNLLQQSTAFDIETANLRIGDYFIEHQVTVERKRYSDFAASLLDGRLFRQAAALGRTPTPLMLIEGPRDPAPAVHPHALKGALLSLATAWRIPVVFSRHAEDSAWILETIGHQCRLRSSLELHRQGYRPKRLHTRRLYVLQGLPGIGPVLAGRLLEKFGSVRGVLTAEEPQLAEVPGCGPKRAAAIARIAG